MKRVDRFRGCIIGLAVGDALGHPTEFISSVAAIKKRYGEQGIVDFSGQGRHPPGTFTDDTQMTVGVLRALIRRGQEPLDVLMELMGDEFVAWSHHRENDRAPGGTCMTGCRNFEGKRAWKEAGVKQSKGCGAAMRAAPIGLFCEDDAQLVRLAAAQSVLTHSHPTGIASSVAAAAAVAHVARGHGLEGLLQYVIDMVGKLDAALLLELGATPELVASIGTREQLAILEKTRAALEQETDDVCSLLGGAWVGEEAVATALWCVLKAKGDFEESIRRGANSSGDSDSIACIAGSITGALHGYDAIPARFTGKLEKCAQLDVLARYLDFVVEKHLDVPSLPGPLDFFDAESEGEEPPGLDSDDPDDEGFDDDGDDTQAGTDGGLGDDDDDEPGTTGEAEQPPDDDEDLTIKSPGEGGGAPPPAPPGKLSAPPEPKRLADEAAPPLDLAEAAPISLTSAAMVSAAPEPTSKRKKRAAAAPLAAVPAPAGPAAAPAVVAALEREVTRHNRLYWQESAPEISDADFDALVRKLTALRPDSPVLGYLGAAPEAFGAVKHAAPMLSLDKAYLLEDIHHWCESFEGEVVAMPKVDGLACTLHYDTEGALVLASTRGDGFVGENVTANVRGIQQVPKALGAGPAEVRGEVYMTLATFEQFKSEGKANPRNLAAGALRQKDPQATARYGLSFIAYDAKGPSFQTLTQKLEWLEARGFAPIPRSRGPRAEIEGLLQAMAARRDALGYETDGVVLTADRLDEQARLGATAHHPRYAIAWKFQGEGGASVLKAVDWSVARTGTITPVAVVEPVALSGVTVTRASLHHVGMVEKLGLSLGATLALVRRGGVIPHVERVLSPGAQPLAIPTTCPSCGSAVLREGDFLKCSTPEDCLRARVERLVHWASATDIQGLGPAILEAAVVSGSVKRPGDLYRLNLATAAGFAGCGEKIAAKLLAEVTRAKSLPLDVFLRGLGIEGLGRTVASQLTATFVTLPALRAASQEALAAVKGIGPLNAKSIAEGLLREAAIIDDLLQHVTIGAKASSLAGTSGLPLSGKSFCFTGALRQDRKVAEGRVQSLGALTSGSVNKALTHLVVGERDGAPSSKLKAAQALIAGGGALVMLDEAQFNALLAPHEAALPPSPEPKVEPSPQLSMF